MRRQGKGDTTSLADQCCMKMADLVKPKIFPLLFKQGQHKNVTKTQTNENYVL